MALPNLPAISLDELKSEQVRNGLGQALNGATRTLQIDGSGLFSFAGSILQQFWGWLTGQGNAIADTLGLGQWGTSTMISWLHQAKQFVWNFNWNSTDEELDQQIRAAEIGLAGLAGAAAGNVAGYVTCGILPSVGITVFNPSVGLYLLKEVGEEALEEATGYVASLIQAGGALLARKVFTESFKSNRAFYNAIANSTGAALELFTRSIGGSLTWQQYREQRGSKDLVTFADFVEENLETLDPPAQAFWENFLEEADDSCWESLYVMAGSFDNWVAQQLSARDIILGPERRVEITPNREIPSEKIVLVGPENFVKPQIVGTLSGYQLMENRDIGQFVGQPAEDYVLGTRLGLRIKITMHPYPSPPFYRGERIRPREVTINIPDVKRSKLDYEAIRLACGGSNGYMWGRFLAQAKLSNGRTVQVWAASETEAESQVQQFLSLSEAEIIKLTVIEEKNAGELLANPALRKDPRQVFPAYLTVWNRNELLSTINAGRSGVRGNFFDKRGRIAIWPDQKPFGFDEVISEVLTRGVTGLPPN